jgi:hypothetical protein
LPNNVRFAVPVEIAGTRDAPRRRYESQADRGLKGGAVGRVHEVIREQKEFWPLSLRQIHYQLLNDPPLIHSNKPGSRYCNDKSSYRALIDLVTRARHEGWIDYDVIEDPTRPVTAWNVQPNLSSYYAQQMEDLLNGYWRDVMQSQTNHFEIVAEKNTLQNILRPVAEKFCIPITFGRGQCSTRPLYDISQRFVASGKSKLIILAVSDLDPDGDEIAHSLGLRLRDDFNIAEVIVIKTALTMEQVIKLKLPTKHERAKTGSTNCQRYIDAYQTDFVWELEAREWTKDVNIPSELTRYLNLLQCPDSGSTRKNVSAANSNGEGSLRNEQIGPQGGCDYRRPPSARRQKYRSGGLPKSLVEGTSRR